MLFSLKGTLFAIDFIIVNEQKKKTKHNYPYRDPDVPGSLR
jgi:hypothetical protein